MRFLKNPILINFLFAVSLTVGIVYAVLRWLDVYTRHNVAVVVPDVKGLRVDKAASFFQANGLEFNVIDSVYSKEVSPGAIVELVPSAGSKVKQGRIVFLTINAESAQTGEIPEVADLSYRQAMALLKSKGFAEIEIEYIVGDYKDLAIAVEAQGRTLKKGDRIPLSTKLKLIVSNNDEVANSDSLAVESTAAQSVDSEEEIWF